MGWLQHIIDIFLHLDRTLESVISQYHTWTYLFLFAVIFCETGFVVTPFLPGDSLIFAAGAVAALPRHTLNIWWLFIVLCVAAIAGDTVNYWIGHFIGPKAFRKEDARFLKKKYLDQTHGFYEKYGGITIVLARFVPFVRTFAPFVAGVGSMSYLNFVVYNVVGGVVWVSLFLLAGYFFGTIPFVKHNFSYVIVAVVLISIAPLVVRYLTERKKRKKAEREIVAEEVGVQGDANGG